MEEPAEYCIVFHFHQPPYDNEHMGYYHDCYGQSYLHHLDILDKFPKLRVNFNISGILLETMEERNHEFIERLRGRVDSGQVYLTACGYTHPIFPLVLERVGAEACRVQVERDLKIKQNLFGASPGVFRPPEYAVSQGVADFLYKTGFEVMMVPGFVFRNNGIDGGACAECGVKENGKTTGAIKVLPRNDDLSNALAGGNFSGGNYFDWLKKYSGTPEHVGRDFALRVASAGRALTDIDAETYNHHLKNSGVPGDRLGVLEAIYQSLDSGSIETVHLPEFICSAGAGKIDHIPRVSYDGERGFSIWEGWPGHEEMWNDIEACWGHYMESGGQDGEILDLALRAQTSCWTWGVSNGYPAWWGEQPKKYRGMVEGFVHGRNKSEGILTT